MLGDVLITNLPPTSTRRSLAMIFSLHIPWKEHCFRQLLIYVGVVQERITCIDVGLGGVLVAFPTVSYIDVEPRGVLHRAFPL